MEERKPPHLPSQEGWICLNFDGSSIGNPGQAGIGGTFRDHTGNTLLGYSGPIGQSTSNMAEARALSWLLMLLNISSSLTISQCLHQSTEHHDIPSGAWKVNFCHSLIKVARMVLKPPGFGAFHIVKSPSRKLHNLTSHPLTTFLPNLVNGYPLLKVPCPKGQSSDQPNIAHIPRTVNLILVFRVSMKRSLQSLLLLFLLALAAVVAVSEALSEMELETNSASVTDKRHRRRHRHSGFSQAECPGACSYRCSKTRHHKPCMFFCQKCCFKCRCVPPGTYGRKEVCPCYNNWKTKEGSPKCP
ncbi:hypothetical protein H6P81_003180 [Aristolochia fimbriata]|uniref:RNase H type-1 domain-containing protein n=1 Tax=Aristolochia fimbriata TaxID=158543 RepID=A0AAV7FG31_ARIFI|nr:hypothetical protein H6P81_003180 [Aristolochia fimbriata]